MKMFSKYFVTIPSLGGSGSLVLRPIAMVVAIVDKVETERTDTMTHRVLT